MTVSEHIGSCEDRKERLIESAFQYYRSNGFPLPYLAPHELLTDFFKLEDTNLKVSKPQSIMFEEMAVKELEVKGIGTNVANAFHPHIWDSHAIYMRSPMESFGSDKLLRRAIWLALETTGKITDASVRNKLKIVSGTQMCSNFRPAVAKAIYDLYAPPDATVLDPSCGYGGRLLGFLASHCTGIYVGVDPSVLTCAGNRNMAEFFGVDDRVILVNSPFEDLQITTLTEFNPSFAFTSPPYFKKEVYAEDDTQSSSRYQTYDGWLSGFWQPTVETVYRVLLLGSIFVINVQDVLISSKQYPLVTDTEEIARKAGFLLIDRLHMRFSGFGKGLKKWKTETVFVFQKEEE